ncbi:MAG TPA: hypothetical protein VEI01_02730 [Terriglobales bacterium]|nr:hypothetical protein [Terriglobales bacterium]
MTDEGTDKLKRRGLLYAIAAKFRLSKLWEWGPIDGPRKDYFSTLPSAERLRKWRMESHKSMGCNRNLVGNHMLDPIIDQLENNGALSGEADRFVTRFLDKGWTLGRAICDDPALLRHYNSLGKHYDITSADQYKLKAF